MRSKVDILKNKIQYLVSFFCAPSILLFKDCVALAKKIKNPAHVLDVLFCTIVFVVICMEIPSITRFEVLLQFSLLNILAIVAQEDDDNLEKESTQTINKITVLLLRYTAVLIFLIIFTPSLDNTLVLELKAKNSLVLSDVVN